MLNDTGEDMPQDLRFAQIDKEEGATVEIDLHEPPIVTADGWKELPGEWVEPAPDLLQYSIILPSGPLGLYESAERAFQILAQGRNTFSTRGKSLSARVLRDWTA
jgi:hypothetical protein